MEEKLCIICGSKAKYDLCYNCFVEKNKIKSELEGSTNTLEDTKDYYNNLKYNIFKLKKMDYAKTACLKLLAIGEVLEQQYNQKGYIDKSKKDAIPVSEEQIMNLLKASEVENPTDEQKKLAEDLIRFSIYRPLEEKKSVWFMICEDGGKYYIAMYYDNKYNEANGEDL